MQRQSIETTPDIFGEDSGQEDIEASAAEEAFSEKDSNSELEIRFDAEELPQGQGDMSTEDPVPPQTVPKTKRLWHHLCILAKVGTETMFPMPRLQARHRNNQSSLSVRYRVDKSPLRSRKFPAPSTNPALSRNPPFRNPFQKANLPRHRSHRHQKPWRRNTKMPLRSRNWILFHLKWTRSRKRHILTQKLIIFIQNQLKNARFRKRTLLTRSP